MKWKSLFAVTVALSACGADQSDARQIADAQSKSGIGSTAEWKLDPALPLSKVQVMRDRAYRYCFSEKVSDTSCLAEQDHSIFAYANSFRLVRIFRRKEIPTFEFAVAHKQNPAEFERVNRYCIAIYEDQRSADARSLGPCMSAGVGADFFGVLPVK